MTKKERFGRILDWFQENDPAPKTELVYQTPFQLLVAVMLSAQCTDKRVNAVAPALFEAFPTPEALAEATFDEVYPYVKSVSYPNSKTAHLISAAKKIISDFGGEVPSRTDQLMTLPRVGRKTANVVTSVIWSEPVIAVDTHVFRVARRLGLSMGTTPLAVETDLEKGIPEGLRSRSHHWLLLHGRYICTARSPKCGKCQFAAWCPSKEEN
jgi:endonuclease-3